MRDHVVFRAPFPIDTGETVPVPKPSSWDDLDAKAVQVLPLTATAESGAMAGWCVYEYSLQELPEIEILCGGINSKMAKAASIFRQGNLLHFGFQPDPEQLNEVGRQLLLNCLAYIARFTEDRPTARTPSIWLREKAMPSRARLTAYDHPSLPRDAAARERWLAEHRGVLAPDADNKLVPDPDLLGLGVGSASERFFEVAIAALSGDRAAAARRVLVRYAPDGPGADADAGAWRAYWKDNGPYLFFSEASGYRWYLDPLAKRRGVPTAKLQGPDRASQPARAEEPDRDRR